MLCTHVIDFSRLSYRFNSTFACKNIEGTLRFPATTRVVSAAAFNGCSKLTELSFDGSTRLGAFAFANCRGLRVVRLSATVPPICADNAFDGIDLSRVQLIVPAQSRKEYRKAQGWRHFFGNVVQNKYLYLDPSHLRFILLIILLKIQIKKLRQTPFFHFNGQRLWE